MSSFQQRRIQWGAGGARAPPEYRGSQKGRSLISAYQSSGMYQRGRQRVGAPPRFLDWSLAIILSMNTPGFEKLNTYGSLVSPFRQKYQQFCPSLYKEVESKQIREHSYMTSDFWVGRQVKPHLILLNKTFLFFFCICLGFGKAIFF